jgi:hypothetical protein
MTVLARVREYQSKTISRRPTRQERGIQERRKERM